MAYVDFSPEAGENRSLQVGVASPAEAAHFEPIELRVIALAEQEDVSRPALHGSRLGRIGAWIFGIDRQRPLANPRLECLRRFASMAFHHPGQLQGKDVSAFVEAGYSRGQAEGLLAHFAERRRRARPGLA